MVVVVVDVVDVVEVLEEVVVVLGVADTTDMDPVAMATHGLVAPATSLLTVQAEIMSTDPVGSVPGVVNHPTRWP